MHQCGFGNLCKPWRDALCANRHRRSGPTDHLLIGCRDGFRSQAGRSRVSADHLGHRSRICRLAAPPNLRQPKTTSTEISEPGQNVRSIRSRQDSRDRGQRRPVGWRCNGFTTRFMVQTAPSASSARVINQAPTRHAKGVPTIIGAPPVRRNGPALLTGRGGAIRRFRPIFYCHSGRQAALYAARPIASRRSTGARRYPSFLRLAISASRLPPFLS